MKRFFSSILILLFATNIFMPCMAQDAKSLTIDNDSIIIDYNKCELSFEGVSEIINQAIGMQLYDENNNIAAFQQTYPDADGSFKFGFCIDEFFSGKPLTLKLSQLGTNGAEKDIYVTGINDINLWLANFKEKNTAEGLELHTRPYVDIVLKYNMDITEYIEYKDRLFDVLKNFKSDYTLVSQLVKEIEQSIAIVKINALDLTGLKAFFDAKTKALFSIDFKILESAFEILEKYKNDKTLIESINTSGNGFSTPNEVVTAIKEACAIAQINCAKAEEMENILKGYDDVFIKVSNEFSTLMKSYTEAAGRSLVDKNFTTLKNIVSTLKTNISLLNKEEEKLNTSTGTSSSSGGGGGKGTFSGFVNTVTPEISAKTKFVDMDNYNWAKDAVENLLERKIVSGRTDSIFAPQEFITREEFVKMAVLLFNIYDSSANTDFIDVKADDWFYSYVASAFNNGFVSGENDKYFGSGKNITRQDIVTILGRALEKKGVDLLNKKVGILDTEDIDEYAKQYVESFFANDILKGTGDGYFEPLRCATRAESAVIIFKVLNILENK